MPTVVDIPDVGEVEFPDGMDDNAIAETIRTKILPPALPQDIPMVDSGPAVIGEDPTLAPTDARFPAAKASVEAGKLGLDLMTLPTKFDWYDTLSKDEKDVQIAQAEAQAALDQPKRDEFEVNDRWIYDEAGVRADLHEASQSKIRAEAMRARHEAVRPATPEEIKGIEQQTEQDNYTRFMETKRKESFIPDVVDTALETVYRNTTSIGATLAQTLAPSMGGAASADLSNRIAESQAYLNTADSMGASIGKGVGEVASLIAGNPAGLPGVAVAASKAAAMAYGQTLAETGSASKAGEAALATAPMLALYMGIGYGAARGVNAMLPEKVGPLAASLLSGGGALLANVGTSKAMAIAEGRDYGLQELTADTLFAIFHGYGEYGPRKAAMELPRQQLMEWTARSELKNRGFSDEQIYTPYQPDSPFRTQVTPAYKLEPRVEPAPKADVAEAVAADRGPTVVEPEATAPAPETAPAPAPAEVSQAEATGIRNAIVDESRTQRGFGEREAVLRRSYGPLLDEAKVQVSKDPLAGSKLVDSLKETIKPLTDAEDAVLTLEQTRREAEHDAAVEAVNSAKTEEARLEAQEKLAQAENSLFDIYTVGQQAGTANARGLAARRLLITRDYNLAQMKNVVRAKVNDGKPLTEKQNAEVTKQAEKVKELETKLAANEEATVKSDASAEFTRLKKETAKKPKEAPSGGVLKFLEEQAQKARDRIKARRGRLQVTVDPLNLVGLADEIIIGSYYVARGVKDLGAWSAKMVGEFGERIRPYLGAAYKKAVEMANENERIANREQILANAKQGELSQKGCL